MIRKKNKCYSINYGQVSSLAIEVNITLPNKLNKKEWNRNHVEYYNWYKKKYFANNYYNKEIKN